MPLEIRVFHRAASFSAAKAVSEAASGEFCAGVVWE
jgi:hypothetical protein